MVINDSCKFVFVHIPKAAGTSIAQALRSLPGNNVHWLAGTKHETLHEFHVNVGARLSEEERRLGKSPIDYFSFAFVRNPWSRMSSLYRYLSEKRPRAEIDAVSSFKEFLVQARDGVEWIRGLHSMRPQVDYLCSPSGTVLIHFVGHFEFLKDDVDAVSMRLGQPVLLGRKNESSNSSRDYRLDYDEEMVEIVRALFREDCVRFGYDFETCVPARRCSGMVPLLTGRP